MPTFEELLARRLVVPLEEIRDEAGRRTIAGWNSLRHVELILDLEERFAVRFTRREIHELSTVGELRAALRSKGAPV